MYSSKVVITAARPANISSSSHSTHLNNSLRGGRACLTCSRVNVVSSSICGGGGGKTSGVAKMWREIQGCNNWEGLVGPGSWLHPLLRQEIIRYGELLAACYKAFDVDPNSTRHLNCKYARDNMFRALGLHDSGYQVTKYIYASPQGTATRGRWIGYVAVATSSSLDDNDDVASLGRSDILVSFRGTVTNPEWLANFMSSLTPARLDPFEPRPEVQVEAGFLSLYTSKESGCRFGLGSCREQLLSEVSRLVKKFKKKGDPTSVSISLVGHSMGSSLAHLLAYDICELGLNKVVVGRGRGGEAATAVTVPVTVFSFGGPRVGNEGFKRRCEELGVKILRVVNVNDPITKLPGVFLNETTPRVLVAGNESYEMPWSCSCYVHLGVEVALEFFSLQNPICVHDLDTYIGLLRCPNKAELLMVPICAVDVTNNAHNFALNLPVLDHLLTHANSWAHDDDDRVVDQLLIDDEYVYMLEGLTNFLAMHIIKLGKSTFFLLLLLFYLSKSGWFQ